ncbi:MAG TPA: 50S ribosomal protein L18 [Dehalococcoidia bacterium]|nr:50S ribosomal protein L18 [Dehalococcoidia bacterium]
MDSRLAQKVRHRRVRKKVIGTALRPRLCVFRSLNHIYAQIIDDSRGQTLVSMSTLDPEVRDKVGGMLKVKKAELVGSMLAQKALDERISCVVFDRRGYKYHGRIKTLADAARKVGLEF